ncbi:MAG: TetR/AcrR family transcriptional regulator [Chloroflexi bacterium]|nr:MAG: TetR/AcrR family transcriptional regulator [Chloroflexota bacterium]
MPAQVATRRPGAVSEKRRQELVLAAYREIAERGFEGLRTREVAAEVGVNIATLHYYFPTKEALIRAVLDHAMGRFRSTLAPHGSPSEQLRNYLRSVRTLLVDEPELGAVMAELALRSVRDSSISAILNQMYDVWHVTMRGLLRRAVREGGLRADIDSDAVAALIVATLTSMTLPVMTDPRRGDRALRQLELWLGVSRRRPAKQLID